MRNIWIIARREYKLYFASPAAYLIAFMILLALGILFYLNLQVAAMQQFAPGVQITLAPMATLIMLATPAITTRLLAEEQRMGTIELLLTAPVRDWELVTGKWLGAFLFLLSIIVVSLIYPLVLNQLVSPGIDQGPLLSGYLGIILLSASLVAVGVAISSFFNNQIAAFATTMGVFILLWWIIGPIAQTMGPAGGGGSDIISSLDFSQHFFNNLIMGVIDLSDVVFYISMTALGIFLGIVSVETRRWR
jgi:ABC-2 type transport system permease protein